MTGLLALDRQLFELVNLRWTHPWLDALFVAVTDFDIWRVPVILLLLVLLARGGTDTRLAILFAVLAVAFSDQIASSWIKPIFDRDRPFHVVPGARKLIGAYSSSFPSSHAANTFAASTFLALRFARLRVLLVVPVLVSYSRVYTGAHWPSDVIAGGVLGAGIGAAFSFVERLARRRFQARRLRGRAPAE